MAEERSAKTPTEGRAHEGHPTRLGVGPSGLPSLHSKISDAPESTAPHTVLMHIGATASIQLDR